MFILRCPQCKHTMKCSPLKKLEDQSKKCVYCNRSFKIKNNIVQKL